MITNLNNTQNGNYMKSSDGGVQTTTFSAYNPAFAFQGKAQTGQADDIFNNPTYEININSAGLAEDPTGTAMFGDIIRQYNAVNNTEYSVQKGDPALLQGEDFDPKVNDEVANKLFELWIAENETFFRDPDARTTGSGILSNIKYRPVYGNKDDAEKPYASYSITLPQDWLKKNQSLALSNNKNKSGFSPYELSQYSTITFTFDNNKDISVRRKGNYNFSEVQSGIANSANGMYQKSYDNGGSLRVWQDVDGFYNLGVTYQQYDPKVDAMVDGPENTIVLDKIMGQQGYSLDDLDMYIMQYDLSIQNVMKENNRKRKENNELNSAPKN
jgi:hypothetical protein